VEAVERGTSIVRKMVEEASKIEREEVPLSRLVLGMECGGSDFSSGLSANPVVGQAAVPFLWEEEGRVILSETTELVGSRTPPL